MKKTILFSLIIILTIFFTGCKNDKTEDVIDNSKKIGDVKDIKIINSQKIEDNSVVFILKNKSNNVQKNVQVTIEFWKKAEASDKLVENEKNKDKLVNSSSEVFIIIEPGQSVVGNLATGKREYDYYKIFIDITKDSKTNMKISEYENFEFDDNTILEVPKKCTELSEAEINKNIKCLNDGDEIPNISDKILLTIKNKSVNNINYYITTVVFYKENKIVGFNKAEGNNLKSKKMRDIYIEFPFNTITHKNIKFDDYTIYTNLAYYRNI